MEATRTHLIVHWDDHRQTFVHLLDHFRLEGLYCDATLACAGGRAYKVHQAVLSAASDFFASLFASASCQNPVVVLQDVLGSELEALLTYIYRGQVLLPKHTLPGFLKVAGSLQVKGISPGPLNPYASDSWGGDSVGVGSDLAHQSTAPHSAHMHAGSNPFPPPPPYPHEDLGCKGLGSLPDPPPYPLEDLRGQDGLWGDGGRSEAPSTSPVLTSPLLAAPQSERSGEGIRQPPRKRFSPHFGGSSRFGGGTFQNLVASEEEEGRIKEEPNEEDMEEEGEEEAEEEEEQKKNSYEEERKEEEEEEEKRLVMEEEEEEEEEEKKEEEEVKEEEHGEEEEGGRKIGTPLSLTSPLPPSPLAPLPPSPSHLTPSPTAAPPAPSAPPASPHPSQLRRELLKPLHSRLTPPAPHHAPLHHSVPHPVIATREGEGLGGTRDPPPLVKIHSPPLAGGLTLLTSLPRHHPYPHQHHQHHHHQHHHSQHASRQKDDRGATTTTINTTSTISITTPTTKSHHHPRHHHHHHPHLLVNTPPTYRSPRPAPPGAPQAPHNLGTYLPKLMPLKVTNLMDSDAPLNLSQDHHSQPAQRDPIRGTPGDRRVRESKDPFLGKILTNRKRRMRGPKSWEYLVRLLKDPTTNPSLIRWENQSKFIFRLVQPAVIAQRWGRRTGKHASECLSYENFARGLRYHYATGALNPVSERSFVYKFGPKALHTLGEDGEFVIPEEVTAGVPHSVPSAVIFPPAPAVTPAAVTGM